MIYSALSQAASPGKVVDPNVTKYSVKVLPVSKFHTYGTYSFKSELTCISGFCCRKEENTCHSMLDRLVDVFQLSWCDGFYFLQFNYDQSMYGFREYFKKHGFKYFETN